MLHNGYDETNGIVIGDYALPYRGILHYDGRVQSGILYAETESDLLAQATVIKHERIEENGGYPLYLYPDNAQWELRIYSGK